MTYAVEVKTLHKRFKGINALQGLSLAVERGTTYGLLGPNGAGKTTLIRTIAGLLSPDMGEVMVLGTRMPNKPILGRVGYMTQSMALYDELSVRQNVQFFAEIAGKDDAKAIDEAIALVDLSKRAHSRVRELSGGMKQRCSLACALVHRPDLVLLDEPTVGVDPQLRAQFWEHFRRLNDAGVTLIVSSHVMDEAERCDKLGFMRDGVLLAEGSASELRQRAGTDNLEAAFLQFAETSHGKDAQL